METRQTSKWLLKGRTHVFENYFGYVGDYIDNTCYIHFNMNGAPKKVAVPTQLKSLGDITDEIKNGYVHYAVNHFVVDHNTVLYTDSSWTQTQTSSVCYFLLPFDAAINTNIMCSTQPVVKGLITSQDLCGIKSINTIIAIRLSNELLKITDASTSQQRILAFSKFFQSNPLEILYTLSRQITYPLKDYSFDILMANNEITCTSRYTPTEFTVEYPVDVIINSNIDVQQIQALANQVAISKAAVEKIQEDLKQSLTQSNEQYTEILIINQNISTTLLTIQRIKEEVEALKTTAESAYSEINKIKIEIENMFVTVQSIQTNVSNAIHSHNTHGESHQDIREIINTIQASIIYDFGVF